MHGLSYASKKFQSTLPAREATPSGQTPMMRALISIHASREGSDTRPVWTPIAPWHFNPRFPRGKRHSRFARTFKRVIFQSTLPAREATIPYSSKQIDADISIHASREGSDSTVKLSPDDRTSRHGFREPGFLRFRHRQISCLFLLGAWGSRL